MRDLTLATQLRDRLLSELHLGHVRAGDRLPSIRQVATETGADARAVARAYRLLEAERLVEVRDRSGIYAAARADAGGALLEEKAQWAARVIVDGWKRGIAAPALGGFLDRCAAGRPVRCAFVESCEDTVTAFDHDLRHGLGLESCIVWVDAPDAAGSRRAPAPRELRDADLVVTTAFHAAEVRPLAAGLGKPLVVATVNAHMVAAIERQARSGRLTVVCADRGFGRRIEMQYPATGRALRTVYADDPQAVRTLDRSEPILLTRAARLRLGDLRVPMVFPHSPTISEASALEIAELVVRLNLPRRAAPPHT